MGFRFRRSVRLFPGLRLNASKSGVSMSVGTRGAWYTIGSKGRRRVTVGLPGTGIGYTQTSHVHREQPRALTPEETAAEYRRSVIRGRFYWAVIFFAVAWYVWSVATGR